MSSGCASCRRTGRFTNASISGSQPMSNGSDVATITSLALIVTGSARRISA